MCFHIVRQRFWMGTYCSCLHAWVELSIRWFGASMVLVILTWYFKNTVESIYYRFIRDGIIRKSWETLDSYKSDGKCTYWAHLLYIFFDKYRIIKKVLPVKGRWVLRIYVPPQLERCRLQILLQHVNRTNRGLYSVLLPFSNYAVNADNYLKVLI